MCGYWLSDWSVTWPSLKFMKINKKSLHFIPPCCLIYATVLPAIIYIFCIESSQYIYLFYETDCLWSKNLIIWSNRKFVNSFKNLFYLWIQNGIDLMEKITFIQMVSWPCPEFQRLFHSNINPGICYERQTASICQDFLWKKVQSQVNKGFKKDKS